MPIDNGDINRPGRLLPGLSGTFAELGSRVSNKDPLDVFRFGDRGSDDIVVLAEPELPKMPSAAPAKKGSSKKSGAKNSGSSINLSALESQLAAQLRGLNPKQQRHLVIPEAFFKLPMDKLVSLIVESGFQNSIFVAGSWDSPRLKIEVSKKDNFQSVVVTGLGRDERRSLKTKTLKQANGLSFVFFEEDSILKGRIVTEESLSQTVTEWIGPESEFRDELLNQLRAQALKNEPLDPISVVRACVRKAVLQALPQWLASSDLPGVQLFKRASEAEDKKEYNELLKVFTYHLDQYLRISLNSVKGRGLKNPAGVLDNVVKATLSVIDSFLPADWAKKENIALNHVWKDYVPEKTNQQFHALLYLLTRTYYQIFRDRGRVHALGIDRFVQMTNPRAHTVEALRQNRFQIAYEMSLLSLRLKESADQIRSRINALLDGAVKLKKYAKSTLYRFVEADSIYAPAIHAALDEAIENPNPERSTFFQVVIHELASQLLDGYKNPGPILEVSLGASVDESYRTYNREKIMSYLESYLAKMGDKKVKEGLIDSQKLMSEFEISLNNNLPLLMLLVSDGDAKSDQIWSSNVINEELDEDLSNDLRFYKLWFIANDQDLQGVPARAIPIYDLILDECFKRDDYEKAAYISLKLAESLMDAGMVGDCKNAINDFSDKISLLTENTRVIFLQQASSIMKRAQLYPEAISLLNMWIKELEKSPELHQADITKATIRKAHLFHLMGDLNKSANAFEKALKDKSLDLSMKAATYGLMANMYKTIAEAEEKPSELKKAALTYFESAEVQKAAGDYANAIDAYAEGFELWQKADSSWDDVCINDALNSLLGIATYIKQGSSILPDAEVREKHMKLFDDVIQLLEKVLGYGVDLGDDVKNEYEELKSKRNVWESAKQIPVATHAAKFNMMLQLIARKVGLSREIILGNWYKHGEFKNTDYVAVNDYLDAYFNSPGSITHKFWKDTKSVLSQLQLSADQIALFEPVVDAITFDHTLAELEATIILDPESSDVEVDAFFERQIISLPAGFGVVPGATLGLTQAFR